VPGPAVKEPEGDTELFETLPRDPILNVLISLKACKRETDSEVRVRHLLLQSRPEPRGVIKGNMREAHRCKLIWKTQTIRSNLDENVLHIPDVFRFFVNLTTGEKETERNTMWNARFVWNDPVVVFGQQSELVDLISYFSWQVHKPDFIRVYFGPHAAEGIS